MVVAVNRLSDHPVPWDVEVSNCLLQRELLKALSEIFRFIYEIS